VSLTEKVYLIQFEGRERTVACSRMFITEGRVLGLSGSRKSPINLCPKANRHEDVDILRLLTELLRSSGAAVPCVHQDPHHYGVVVGLLLCVSRKQYLQKLYKCKLLI